MYILLNRILEILIFFNSLILEIREWTFYKEFHYLSVLR